MRGEIKNLLKFYSASEKLKVTLRDSWLSDPERQESSAEHSWMLGLLSMVLFNHIPTKVDQLKVLKMVIIHDLAESIIGDIPAFEKSKRQDNKHKSERKALIKLVSTLPPETAKEILSLWDEVEECKTNEAKVAMAIDKIEVLMQHNTADIKTWGQGDFDIGPYYKDLYFDFDSFFREFKDVVDRETMKKILKAKMESRIDSVHLKRFRQRKQ
jgi:putative hydrolases of HD superfamily